jgi:hypothetical protein
MEELLNLLDELGGPSGVITSTFVAIEAVEEEIEAGMARHPARAHLIWEMFRLLGREHERMGPINLDLFRTQCRQLIDRCGRGESLDEPTGIDLILGFSEVSLAFPLPASAERAYIQLWREHVGHLPEVGDLDTTFEDLDYRLSARAHQDEVNDQITFAARAIKRRQDRQMFFDEHIAEKMTESGQLKLMEAA